MQGHGEGNEETSGHNMEQLQTLLLEEVAEMSREECRQQRCMNMLAQTSKAGLRELLGCQRLLVKSPGILTPENECLHYHFSTM